MQSADLVVSSSGRPVIVVEAKPRQVPKEYSNIIELQIIRLFQESDARWLILIDPIRARLFRAVSPRSPVLELRTRDLVDAAGFGPAVVIGESVALHAVEKWIERLARGGAAEANAPLRELAADLGDEANLVYEFAVA